MLNVRRLAAIDVALLGPTLIITEFAAGVVGALALGVFTVVRSRSLSGQLLGAYLIALGVNYVPLLMHAISFRGRERARAEVADELTPDPRRAMRKYRRWSLLLLLPLVVPVLAVVQARRRRVAARAG